MYADPDSPVVRRIRADWPGALVANPVLPEISAEAVHRESARLPAAGADLTTLDQLSSDSNVALDGERVA
ncbi:hypothetical protein [Streptomyces sp. TRM68367]|uniref:hypothetical protein n=1 Tax=Streptomyces sp. TRM68367 TaxID=2758415 RepID=UPI00165CB2C0|nr:hypothetical protein [Streptomyces sp. TRM68367]MBC9729395.1 hypothetical protein [Streptomyces sp. TRM68367]